MKKTLRELADNVGGRVIGDGAVLIGRMAAIEDAGQGDITFVSNPKYIPRIGDTGASAVIVSPELARGGKNFLVCENPYLAFAQIAGLLSEPPPRQRPGIDARAAVSPDASLGEGVSAGAFVTVEAGCVVGARVVLMPGAYLGPNVSVGAGSVLHPNVCVYHGCRIGERVTLHANATVGSDGFGFAPDGERYEPIPQRRIAIVEDDVSVGANTTVNRGALRDTVIGRGSKIDSCCVISHGVRIGENCLVVSQVGVSGTVTIGRNVTLAGQVGVAGHLTICDNVRVGGRAVVTGDLDEPGDYLGFPARPRAHAALSLAAATRLPEMRRELQALRRRIEDLERRLAEREDA